MGGNKHHRREYQQQDSLHFSLFVEWKNQQISNFGNWRRKAGKVQESNEKESFVSFPKCAMGESCSIFFSSIGFSKIILSFIEFSSTFFCFSGQNGKFFWPCCPPGFFFLKNYVIKKEREREKKKRKKNKERQKERILSLVF